MEMALASPAGALVFGISTMIFSVLIPVLGTGIFFYIIYRRIIPLFKGAKDPRFGQWSERLLNMLKYALVQYRQPRYRLAGILYILLFSGFIFLSLPPITLVFLRI